MAPVLEPDEDFVVEVELEVDVFEADDRHTDEK